MKKYHEFSALFIGKLSGRTLHRQTVRNFYLYMLFIIFELTVLQACTVDKSEFLPKKEENISELQLKWRDKSPGIDKFYLILSSDDKDLIHNFVSSLSDVEFSEGNWSSYTKTGFGTIIIKKKDGQPVNISVTKYGFFIYGKRQHRYLFYSSLLAQFIRKIIKSSKNEKRYFELEYTTMSFLGWIVKYQQPNPWSFFFGYLRPILSNAAYSQIVLSFDLQSAAMLMQS